MKKIQSSFLNDDGNFLDKEKSVFGTFDMATFKKGNYQLVTDEKYFGQFELFSIN